MRETLFGLSLALLALGFFAGTPVASAGTPVASTAEQMKIFSGGPVITTDPKTGKMVEAQAIAVRNGTIISVGDDAAVTKFVNDILGRREATIEFERVNLNGHTLLPGFVEPHTHLALTVQSQPQFSIDCGDQKPNLPVETVLDRLKAAADLAPAGQWVLGTNFDPARSNPLFASLDAKTLDEKVSSTHPVFVLNASGHIAYVNSAALKAAVPPITRNTPNPSGGGEIVKDKNGEPTGQLNELSAINLVAKNIPPPPNADTLLPQTAACVIQQWAATGVTTSTEISLGLTIGVDADLELYKALAKKKGPIRFRVYLDYRQVTPDDRRFLVKRYTDKENNDWLEFLGVKFVTDGSTQGLTAALNQPYLYQPGLDTTDYGTKPALDPINYGTFNFPSPKEATQTNPTLIDAMRPFYKAGWQIVAHANGDRAIDQVLDTYKTLLGEKPALATTKERSLRRLRIDHFTVTTPGQLQQVADLGLTPGMTAGHLYFWGQDFYQPILGPERANKIHPSASLKAKNIRFAYHSDSPVTKVEPLRYVQTEVTRVPQWVPQLVPPLPPFIMGKDQRISVEDALRAVTLDAAYQVFFDDKVGSLEVGKLADFVVLDRNPLDPKVDPSTIASIQVLETYLGGERVYKLGDLVSKESPCALLPK
ncbi:MAG TPA: amidohydrolase family protein [Thermoanaerobaculia bacterium]|nr:amidohydrolase family protein [Thermoanaerobaculia bacterium]